MIVWFFCRNVTLDFRKYFHFFALKCLHILLLKGGSKVFSLIQTQTRGFSVYDLCEDFRFLHPNLKWSRVILWSWEIKQCISQLSGALDCLYNPHFLFCHPRKGYLCSPHGNDSAWHFKAHLTNTSTQTQPSQQSFRPLICLHPQSLTSLSQGLINQCW